ncbi:hypothetical protein N657DRAFT_644252 [Parathielavia appendiculata]|uniref:Uncharacterized protein n=1 Tax=Parathielavia appendiculata TaxID=2587402 RepID=A0AAN6U3A1_9PEZI|nr:hypothetical protein N657DRAFT_644252 [Parathielavia appendiculata]
MGHSYPKNPSTTARTPVQWTDQVRHKYCGAEDLGRDGKPNKVHRCEACLAIKARQSKWHGGPQGKRSGTQQKIGWHAGEFGGAGGMES